MVEEFGASLYIANGPTVSFYGFPYPTRMAVARLSQGSAWVWSPIALTDELIEAVEAIGPVRHIVSPNKLHHLFLAQWSERWPEARVYAPPGLANKMPELGFDSTLGDESDPSWSNDIDQVVFRGSLAMEEVVFFHRQSRTAIFGDLIQRFPEGAARGWKGVVMKLDGLVGAHGSTPREWRATFIQRSKARAARETVRGWKAERLLIAHGECARTGAWKIIEDSLSWI